MKRLLLMGLSMALITSAAPAMASSWDDSVGRVLSVRGQAGFRESKDSRTALTDLEKGMWLKKGTVVKTKRDGSVRLLMKDKSVLDIGPSSYLTLARYEVKKKKRSVGIHLFVGRLWARVTKAVGAERNYEVFTSNAVAGVRGTEIVVDVAPSGATEVTCVTGSVQVESLKGSRTSRLLGALQRGGVDSKGGMTFKRVTMKQVKAMASKMQTGSGLGGSSDGKKRLQKASKTTGKPVPKTDGAGGGQDGGGDGGSPADDVDQTNAGPPVQLEPAAADVGGSSTRVRGQIEVRNPQ